MPFTSSNESSTDINLAPPISALLDGAVASIIRTVIGVGCVVFTGVFGILANLTNMCVYLKMGINETTNMSFFALSVFDLLVCMSTTVAQIANSNMIVFLLMPSGAPWMELGFSSIYVSYPCFGCSAWVTAVLSVERYLCIATPLKVKDIFTPQKTRAAILLMVTYQSVFLVLFFAYPGPPYRMSDSRRSLYFNCSFSAPTFICFFIVSVSTVLLIIALRRSLEWRNKSSTQSSKGSGDTKEKKATRSVLTICIIFIACYSLNIVVFLVSVINTDFSPLNPNLGGLFTAVYSFTILFQVLCSTVNIFVYYKMSTKYREVFDSLFCCKTKINH